jgi:hypothetical protein
MSPPAATPFNAHICSCRWHHTVSVSILSCLSHCALEVPLNE